MAHIEQINVRVRVPKWIIAAVLLSAMLISSAERLLGWALSRITVDVR